MSPSQLIDDLQTLERYGSLCFRKIRFVIDGTFDDDEKAELLEILQEIQLLAIKASINLKSTDEHAKSKTWASGKNPQNAHKPIFCNSKGPAQVGPFQKRTIMLDATPLPPKNEQTQIKMTMPIDLEFFTAILEVVNKYAKRRKKKTKIKPENGESVIYIES